MLHTKVSHILFRILNPMFARPIGPLRYAAVLRRILYAAWFGLLCQASLRAQEARRLIVGCDANYPPYEYQDAQGLPAGFNVDIIRELARETGVAIEIRTGPYEKIRADFESGRIDILAGWSLTKERARRYLFTVHLNQISWSIFIRTGSPDISSEADLAGLSILAQRGDANFDYFTSRKYRVLGVATPEEAFRELAAGRGDCAIVNKGVGLFILHRDGITNIKRLNVNFQSLKYCIALHKGDEELHGRLNEAIFVLKESGKFREIYDRHFAQLEQEELSLVTVLQRALVILIPAAILLLVVLAWTLSLRRQVRKQTFTLAQEKERLSVTLRSIGDGVITTDTHGTIVMMNKAAEELTGWKANDAYGRSLPEVFVIVHEITREACENPVNIVLSTGGSIELTHHTCLISKDGREIQIADSGAPIRDADSRITGVVLVFRDVTEKQKLSESMQRAQKLESLGILAGGIAHDFNNMLAGIFGYLELVNDHVKANKPELIPNYLEKALGVFDRAKNLTQQLLTFARGGTPICKTQHLAPIIRHSANFALSGSNVTCHFDLADDLWVCDCDENQIGQVIDNIVINGKQAMPAGGNMTITAVNCAGVPGHPGNSVRISIQDRGIGIPKECLAKIFDPFFSTKETGHGLGLATVFSIMQRHDGWIEVDSNPGKGSTFHLSIPASGLKASTGTRTDAMAHTGEGTILVMDDEVFMLEIVGTMFESMGYTVARAKDGSEALALFTAADRSGRPFAACILDLTIPGGAGGRETAAAMRKINPHAVLIASSGYSEDPIIAHPADYGFTDRIIKPYQKRDLMELMQRSHQR